MSVNFAGARTVDDRRRRRIAQEEQETESVSRASSGYSSPIHSRPDLPEGIRERSPLDAAIPQNRFWLTVLLGIAFGITGGSLYLGILDHLEIATGVSLFAPLYNLDSGITSRIIPGLMFLLSAQLCGVIFWHRQQNSRDFNGYYRTWLWAATSWLIFGAMILCGGHEIFGLLVAKGLCLPLSGTEKYLWVAPALAIVMEIVRGLDRELGNNRWAWWMYAGCLTTTGFAVASLFGWAPLPNELGNLLLLKISCAATPLMLFSTCLLHTHHVMHVTAAPAPVRRSPVLKFVAALPSLGWKVLSTLFRVFIGRKLTEEEKAVRLQKRKEREEKKQAELEAKATEKQVKEQQRKAAKAAVLKAKQEARELAQLEKEERLAAEKERKELLNLEKQEAAEAKARAKAEARAESERKKQEAKAEAERKKQEAAEAKKHAEAEKRRAKEAEQESFEAAEIDDLHSHQKNDESIDFPVDDYEPEQQRKKPRIRVKSGSSHQQDRHSQDDNYESWEDDAQQSSKNQKTYRVDEGEKLDPNMLKGLSKRERRKLRKQFREQQRMMDEEQYH